MPTAPTLVAAYVGTGSGTTKTTSSLTLSAGDVVTIGAVGEGQANGDSYSAPTTTFANGGITQLQLHAAASNCEGGMWTFTVTTGGSGTVTLARTPAIARNYILAVVAHSGGTAATVGRSATASSSARTLSYTPSQANSAIFWLVGDWAAIAVVAVTPTSTTHASGSPGPTALPQSAQVAAVYSEYASILDDQASAGAVSYGVGGSGTGPFTILVAEIQGSGGGAAIPPIIVMPPRR